MELLAPRLEGQVPAPEETPREGATACGGGEKACGSGEAPSTDDPPLSPPATLDVRVVGWLRAPVAGAMVLVTEADRSGRKTKVVHEPVATDAEGRARISELRSRLVTIEVRAAGHVPLESWMSPTLPPEAIQTFTLQLTPLLRVRVRVTDAVDGRPLKDARVFARNDGFRSLYRHEEWGQYFKTSEPLPTDEHGECLLDVGLGTTYGVWADIAGYARGERELVLSTPEAPRPLELALARGGRVRATVRDAQGAPVAEYRVSLVPRDFRHELRAPWDLFEALPASDDPLEEEIRELGVCGGGSWFVPDQAHPIYSAVTDEEGVAVIEGLALGRTFGVGRERDTMRSDYGKGGVLAPAPDVTPTADTPEVRLELRRETWVSARVRILDPEGAGLSRATVRFDGQGGVEDSREPGTWRFEELAPGPRRLEVSCPGFVPQQRDIDVSIGERRTQEVRLERGALIRGTLLDERGLPFGQAWVDANAEGLGAGRADVDPTGAFELRAGLPGRYGLTFHASDARSTGEVEVVAPAADVRLTLPRSLRVTVGVHLREPDLGDASRSWLAQSADDRGWGHGAEAVEQRGDWRRWELFPGRYVLILKIDTCIAFEHPFEVPRSGALDLGTLEVTTSPPVDGLVSFPDGGAVPNAQLHLRGLAMVMTDWEGRFHLDHGPRGPVTAVVGGAGRPARLVSLSPPAPGTLWRIVLELGGTLQGLVQHDVDPSGLRVEIAPLDTSGRRPFAPPRLDVEGRFVAVLMPGRYRVSVAGADGVRVAREVVVTEGETTSVALTLPAAGR